MRSEQEMLELIVSVAENDHRIRAVMMNGSRANPNAPGDIFQDFDVIYFVASVAPFKEDRAWIDRFGERMILQIPEEMRDTPPVDDASFSFLMQFKDGNRIDLCLYPIPKLDELKSDSLSLLLLDKDGLFEPLAPANESDYLPRPPTAKEFFDCCNEFWWVCPYVAKGLWRAEILYAKYMLDLVMREQLMKMLTWYLGIKTRFSSNLGKFGKYFEKYLEPELWDLLKQTYAGASYDDTWEALYTMCNLFRITAMVVAEKYGYNYPHSDDEEVSAHMKHVRLLPKNAKEMY